MIPDDIEVRTARAPETVALHEMWLTAPDRYDWAPAESDDAPLLAELDVLVADRRVWGAFDANGSPVGLAAAGEIDSQLFLAVLGVAEEVRLQGIGRALLEPVLEFGVAAQYPALVTVTARHGAGATFLRHCGFVDLPEGRESAGLAALLGDDPSAPTKAAFARPL
ncbi:GNAT family N-acetyltransferase [Rhodobium gokarnense]|uniref:GNAT superfamily N-acetyltransferase n=1 Tax=Rhodobium gokarnense TaxID=364296 RepID=A0ABT3HE73_9HYPH|nr:GNAT family N-acetyltransferase [Rhodobium gokarnense]MCW2308692.1 GNAT superfamily N-acetyltransferase [Rhodobium gokarnense]